jgi:hypothetical protein
MVGQEDWALGHPSLPAIAYVVPAEVVMVVTELYLAYRGHLPLLLEREVIAGYPVPKPFMRNAKGTERQ